MKHRNPSHDPAHLAVISIVAIVAVIGALLLFFSFVNGSGTLAGKATEILSTEQLITETGTQLGELEDLIILSGYSTGTQDALYGFTSDSKGWLGDLESSRTVAEYGTVTDVTFAELDASLTALLAAPDIRGDRGLWQALASLQKNLQRRELSDQAKLRGLLNAIKLIKKNICESPYAAPSANNPRACL